MYTTVGRLSSYISQGVYTFSGPFHPFGGAVDIVVVEQQDGTFKSTPWYVKFGKFQGVLKRREKTVAVGVNDVDAGFHMYLDHKGEAYFLEDASDDEKQPFSPPSGPSSGDEAQETLALEYHKSTATPNDSSAEEEPEAAHELLQFEDSCSEGVSRTASQEGSKIQELLLNGAVGGGRNEKESITTATATPAAALFANSALLSIQNVAEAAPRQEEEGVVEETTTVATSVVSEEQEASFSSANGSANGGEYLINSFEVTQVVDDRYVIKQAGNDDVDIHVSELEKQVPESESSRELSLVAVENGEAAKVPNDQEKAWTEVITKAASLLQEDPSQKKISKATNVERRTWGWWVWRGGGTSKPPAAVTKSERNSSKRNGNRIRLEEEEPVVSVEEHCVERTAVTAENVVELLDRNWAAGSGGKRGNTPESSNSEVKVEEINGVGDELGKERSITNNVDLSTAEVVLMSVDGLVVVAEQDDRLSGKRKSGGRLDQQRFSTTTAPIRVPGKRILELADGAELKVGSESTLDTSSHRTEFGRLSNSLSSYFVGKEGKSSAAVDDESNVASPFPSAGDMDEAVEKASMDVQVGSSWSAVRTVEDSDSLKAEEAGSQAEVEMPSNTGFELSLCRPFLKEGMGVEAAAKVFDEHKVTSSSFKSSASLMGNEALVVRVGGKYYPSGVAASILFGLLAFGQVIPPKDGEPLKVEASQRKDMALTETRTSTGGWRFWPFALRRSKPSDTNKVVSSEALLAATEAALHNSIATGLIRNNYYRRSWTLKVKTLIPTSEQLASLHLKPGRNKITFTFTTRVLGKQQVDARIYLWKWNTKVVVSDVDGTITKSDVLGQVMPLVGRDWTQTGVTRLFSAIKDNGYELMFLSARAISQAYLTRQFLVNLKQDGEPLPDGPVVISPDGLFPSLYREVIRRAPHEFKIACLEDVKSLFPAECQPFYAGFGNRDTDEISYLKVGVPKGKIFIINPKGEVIVNNILDMKSYTSLHKLVNDMFPPVNLSEREDFNSWNYWKMPIPNVEDL